MGKAYSSHYRYSFFLLADDIRIKPKDLTKIPVVKIANRSWEPPMKEIRAMNGELEDEAATLWEGCSDSE